LREGQSAIGVFEKFNHVRNNQSLAHDNELLKPFEARFVYDSITAFLRFVKNLEAGRFELSQHQPNTSEALGESDVPF
jgi:hypothetical protein